MNLAIDIGNTLIKFGVFDNDNLVEVVREKTFDAVKAKRLLQKYNVNAVAIGDVSGTNDALIKFFKNNLATTILDHTTPVSIKKNYETPTTLGADRLANMLGVSKIYPNRNAMVVDLGTCLKFDFINSDNQYLGGYISPGIDLRFRSLHNFTGKLPLVEFEVLQDPIGKNTASSIRSGVYFGIRNEIIGMINYKQTQTNKTHWLQ